MAEHQDISRNLNKTNLFFFTFNTKKNLLLYFY